MSKINILKSIIYRPGVYNLLTRTVAFPDQKKLLEKIDLRYIKTLKFKYLKPSNKTLSKFKVYENIQTRFVKFIDQKKTAKNVTKN